MHLKPRASISLTHIDLCMFHLLFQFLWVFWFFEFWSDVWPNTRNLCSAFNPSKCTHTAVNTHTPWTHTRSSGQPCSRAPQSWYWRWRERWTFTPPTDNSCRTRDSNPQPRVTSPTLYPLGHDRHHVDDMHFAIWRWGTLFLKYSTIFLRTLSQIEEPLPIFTSERLCLSKTSLLCYRPDVN